MAQPVSIRMRLLHLVQAHGALAAACGVIVIAGVALRAQDVGWPDFLTWDEHHFVENARNYLQGKKDWNDHPPLGKFFILFGIQAFGDNGLGWRIAPVVFGVITIGLGACIARRLFRTPQAAMIAGALLAADGFLIAYSRTALLDGMLAAFTLAVLLSAVLARRPWHVAICGLLIGLTSGIKVSGLALAVPVGVTLLLRGVPWWSLAFLGGAVPVYFAICCLGLWLTHLPYGVVDAYVQTMTLVAGHLRANEWKHPLTSHWYTWFVPTKPLMLSHDFIAPYRLRVMNSLGNLALWHTSLLAILVSTASVAWRAGKALLMRLRGARPRFRFQNPVIVPLAFWLSMMAPWVVSDRDSYMYHYLPSYTVGLVLLSGVVSRLYHRPRWRVPMLAFVLFAGLVFAWYAPVWGRLPINAGGLQARLGPWL